MNPDPSRRDRQLVHADISGAIIGAFYKVYNDLGFGFLESIYARALEKVLVRGGHRIDREFPVTIYFEGEAIGFHRCDMIVDRLVIVEIKATELLSGAPKRQLRNYWSALHLELGMLLHFGPKATYYRILGPLKQKARAESEESG